MFGALFRPRYDIMVAFTSLTFAISGVIVGLRFGNVGVEVFYAASTWITLSMIVSAIGYFIRKLLFFSFNLQVQAEASTKSVSDLLNSLPDSVLLLSEKTLQSTGEIVQPGISQHINILGEENKIKIGQEYGGVNF